MVSIISLLSSIVLSALGSARAKARNANRLEAIHTLVNAFNLSLKDASSLPAGNCCVSQTCYDGHASYVADATVDAFLAPSLSQKPVDPADAGRGYGGYIYRNPSTVNGSTGAWLQYNLEPGGSCGIGAFTAQVNANFVDCYLKID